MIKKIFILCFVFVQLAYAQKGPVSKTTKGDELTKFRQSLFKGGHLNEAALAARIKSELQKLSGLRQQPSSMSDIYLLIIMHKQTSSAKKQQLGKTQEELESFKQIVKSKNWVISDSEASGHITNLSRYGSEIADPNMAEDFWLTLEGTPFFMKNDKIARLIYERLIAVQTDLGLLTASFNTAKRWTEDKRANPDFNFEGLYEMTDLATGAVSDATVAETVKKMDLSKKLSEVKIILLLAKLDFKKGDFQKCENAISPVLNDVSNTEDARNFHYRAKDYIVRCLLAQNKTEQIKKLYTLPLSRSLENFFLLNPTRKIMSDLRFQMGLGMRKEAFDTCSNLFSYSVIKQPFYYAKFLATCYALKSSNNTWPAFLVGKYNQDLPKLMDYSKRSADIADFLQLIRDYSSEDKSEKAKSLKDKIIKKYGSDDLLSIAISIKN